MKPIFKWIIYLEIFIVFAIFFGYIYYENETFWKNRSYQFPSPMINNQEIPKVNANLSLCDIEIDIEAVTNNTKRLSDISKPK